jgi:hypothetical protein
MITSGDQMEAVTTAVTGGVVLTGYLSTALVVAIGCAMVEAMAPGWLGHAVPAVLAAVVWPLVMLVTLVGKLAVTYLHAGWQGGQGHHFPGRAPRRGRGAHRVKRA